MILRCVARMECPKTKQIDRDEWARTSVRDKIFLCENWKCGTCDKKKEQ